PVGTRSLRGVLASDIPWKRTDSPYVAPRHRSSGRAFWLLICDHVSVWGGRSTTGGYPVDREAVPDVVNLRCQSDLEQAPEAKWWIRHPREARSHRHIGTQAEEAPAAWASQIVALPKKTRADAVRGIGSEEISFDRLVGCSVPLTDPVPFFKRQPSF